MRRLGIPGSILSVVLSTTVSALSAQEEQSNRLISKELIGLSARNGGHPIDCGSTIFNKPKTAMLTCGRNALSNRSPFFLVYFDPNFDSDLEFFRSAYGLAADRAGNAYEVEYDSRGLLHLGMRKKSRVLNGNQIRLTPCVKPIRLTRTPNGVVACVTPVNEEESQRATQQTPIETNVCAVLQHPSAFNNKLVRIHAYASGNFEYSELGADGCSDSLWLAYGSDKESPPRLVATINGGAMAGAEDTEGKFIRPVPIRLVVDANFKRFNALMEKRAADDEKSMSEKAPTVTFYRVAATFTGRIDGVSDDIHTFHLKRKETDRVDYLGFGQMGLFDAQFVLQSVEGDAVLESSPAIPNPLYKKPD